MGTRRLAALGLAAAALIVFGVAIARFPLSADVGWFMSAARRVLDGERLYRDIIEVNPPLVIYLLMPAVVLSDLTRLSDALSLKLLVLGIASCSIPWYMRLAGHRRFSIMTAWWVVVLLFAMLVIPGPDFGQREHLLVLLTMPFAAVKWRRVSHLEVAPREAWIAGAVAGLGFALKPHFLLIWLALEALDGVIGFRRPRAFRMKPEAVSVAAVCALYAIFAIAVHPAYFPLMVELGPLYSQSLSAGSRLLLVVYFGSSLLLALVAAAVSRGTTREHNVALVFLAFGCAGLAGAVLQGKGWRYHSLPVTIPAVLAWAALIQDAVRTVTAERPRRERRRAVLGAGILLMAVYPLQYDVTQALNLAREQRLEVLGQADEVAAFGPETILVFGDDNGDAFPLVNHVGARPISPYPAMWWLRAIHGSGEEASATPGANEVSATERRLSGVLVERFLRDPPDLVLVDTAKSQRFGSAFPYLEYFSRDSAFSEAWKGYARGGAVGHLAVWRPR